MAKYTAMTDTIFSVFDTPAWKATNIEAWPSDYSGTKAPEHVRLTIVPGNMSYNKASITGLLIVDIFTPAGLGPKRQNVIADTLDQFLENKVFPVAPKCITQFATSALQPLGLDKANPTLSRAKYEISFQFSRSE